MIRNLRAGAAAACLLTGSIAWGAGFQLYTEGSAEALGQAGAISGRDDLISLAWYNPAALAGTQRSKIMLGTAFVQINTDFSGPLGHAAMADDRRIIPHAYYVQPVSSNVTATVSVNAPYGLITEWPDNWVGNGIATYTELQTIYITPSVAYRISDPLSVAAGFNVVYADAELQRIMTPPGVPSTLSGDDVGFGGSVSARYQFLDDWALGARYQSRVDLGMEGTVDTGPVSTPGSVDVVLPSSVNAGIANTSVRNLSLGMDVVWTEWSTYDQLAVETAAGTLVIPKDWDNVWSIRVGGEYTLADAWIIRAGYVWDESPVPDTTRAPELPGSDRQMVMAGVGWAGERILVDLAYSYLWAADAKMGTLYAPLTGEFSTDTRIVEISVGYVF